MNLDDTIGDILRKARVSTGTTMEAAATAAGLSVDAYRQFEETGKAPAGTRWVELGARLTLDGGRLQRQHDGWMPEPVDLSKWCELRMLTSTGDGVTVNCYLVWDEVTREAALFDTGYDGAAILSLIDANQLQLKHVFITHSHGDHIAALGAVRERFPKARIHSGNKNAPVEHRIRSNDFIMLGSLRVTNRETPGHAEDGVTYIVGTWPEDAPHVAMVGDALFAGSMGGAKEHLELARQKVREQIFSLPAETLVCPGHGPLTTVAQEKANNPWFG
ncbi:MAG: MBL fold metallo-hydrolase [Verrucomicrobia bacterium]|nr:MAG: MBL fold metallo-hydrolase [Verrucomicrobiota bacterium]